MGDKRDPEVRLALLEDWIEQIKNDTHEIKRALQGNGRPGLMTRLDRLEQKESVRDRHFWVIYPILASLAIGAVWALLTGGIR